MTRVALLPDVSTNSAGRRTGASERSARVLEGVMHHLFINMITPLLIGIAIGLGIIVYVSNKPPEKKEKSKIDAAIEA